MIEPGSAVKGPSRPVTVGRSGLDNFRSTGTLGLRRGTGADDRIGSSSTGKGILF